MKYFLYRSTVCIICFFFFVKSARGQFTLVRNAQPNSGQNNSYILTRSFNQGGAIWHQNQIDLRDPFVLNFTINLQPSAGESGGDGLAFVLQKVSANAFGSVGSGLGYNNLIPSIAAEIDTYRNHNLGDPGFDHMALQRNGESNHDSNLCLVKPVSVLPDGTSITDGKDHLLTIKWTGNSKKLEILVDKVSRIETTIDLIKDIFGGESKVWWGITATTGSAILTQTITFLEPCRPILYVPDAFTPNGDGINDVFEIKANQRVELNMTIYNKWGNAVYRMAGRDVTWNGVNSEPGNYVYTVTYTCPDIPSSATFSKSGSIILLQK
ncbi:lectin-like domain-containing protein [Tellurirhabdus rosea]|uniref:lectin-like domain-containing protein n=1 Tax=Tellurirhabdus rosea TaxID=2674997 RepID=UPI0022588199|nr:gliding motility-associated C-terminal domain-containing protein [Tellurirhabdus rosea]